MTYVNGYGYGGSPYWQFIDANGNPLSNGKVATYIAGTTTAYNTLKDWNHTYNGVVFDLDIRGGCSMIWPTTQLIKIIVKDVDGNLFKTLDNIQSSGSEGGYIPGTTVIRVDGTDNEIISTASADPEDPTKLIFTISLDPAITEAIATNASDISNIETSITNVESSLQTKESLQYTGFRINSGSGPYFVKIAEASFQSGYGSMDLTCGVGGSSTAYGEFSVKVIRAINGTSMYAQWNSLFNRASTFQLEEIRCFYVGPNDVQLWAKTASPFTQSSLSFEPLINVRYSSSGDAIGRAFSFQKVGTTGSYPSTYVNYCLAKSVDCLSASDQRRTEVTSSDASVEVTKTETYDGKGYTNTFDVSVPSGQVDTYKSMCSTGDVPDYLQNKLAGSDWIDATEIPLSADEKNIKFALKNPDFFVKGNTIYGGTVIGVIGDLDEQSHDGYYTCYHSTLHAPPAQPGNPSWFIHHMNSNTANYYAVQIAYAYTSTIICYERTKVAGVWQAWQLRGSGSSVSEVAHIATGDSLGAKDIIQLQAGSSTQWSAHAAMCSTIGAITPQITSEMGFIATQVVTGNFIIAAYKVETSLAHSLICSTGVTAFPSLAGWISAPVLNHVKAISANDRVYLVVMTDCNGVAMAGASCTAFNIQPYVAGIKTNMGVLTEAPATLTFDSETTSRPFIYMVK